MLDIVVPNTEKLFDEIKNLFKQYFLVSKVSLCELLTDQFCETFLKNGDLYLHSYNTKLDCDNCACLLPNGRLVLNITKSLYERIPLNYAKKNVKSTGYEKYELNLSLLEIRKDSKKLELMKKIFEPIEFSFYAYWESKNEDENQKEALDEIFGSKRVFNCLNRIDSSVKMCSEEILKNHLMNESLYPIDWIEIDNIFGCLINDINIEKFLEKAIDGKKSKYVSILRVKGMFPNKLVDRIMNKHLKPLIDKEIEYKKLIMNDSEYDFERVYLKVHGFRDCPVSVIDLDHSLSQKLRTNEENFVAICYNFRSGDFESFSFYKDFNKLFISIPNK